MSQGMTQDLAAKQIGISTQTRIRWRKEYGSLRMDHAKRLKQLEQENSRLKRLLAEAELDRASPTVPTELHPLVRRRTTYRLINAPYRQRIFCDHRYQRSDRADQSQSSSW